MPKFTQKLKDKRIHIVSFDVPYPADYGGAIDVFYRICALKQLGYSITLHCFEYGRGKQSSLLDYCDKVIYYRRKKTLFDWFSSIPFIIKSRKEYALLENLLLDDAPILFEGLHTTYFLKDERLKDRMKIVRTHNIEHDYYRFLSKKATGKDKVYFSSEAKKLEAYESVLTYANAILAIQAKDKEHFEQYCPDNTHLLRASYPAFNSVFASTKPYALFHGNLSVQENENAANWLIDAVFTKASYEAIIAGKNPSLGLVNKCKAANVKVIPNPTDIEMKAYVSNARVHTLITDQNTGLKLKLLNALNSSGHVIVNENMVSGTELRQLCIVTDGGNEMNTAITKALAEPLDQNSFNERIRQLNSMFNTVENCRIVFGALLDN